MNWIYGILIFIAGIFFPFLLLGFLEFIEEIWRDLKRRKWKRDNYGKWLIHSHAGSGSDYSNGGRYTIYRCGFDLVDGKYNSEFYRWEPPMKTEAEALAECARLNALPDAAHP